MNLLSRQAPAFPPVEKALEDPNGLLAVGGALNADWLTLAYRRGIFPWFDSDDGPILWWSPDPRAVLFPDRIHISRSLAKRLRNGGFTVTADRAFSEVIAGCAEERRSAPPGASGTWITSRMIDAYTDLHRLGLAHSIEVWQDTEAGRTLVGGLYGVSMGWMFFGESMFSRVPDASKIALCHLARQLEDWNFWLIDCQMANPHLTSMGAEDIPREAFIDLIDRNADQPTRQGPWTLEAFPAESWSKRNTTGEVTES